MARSAISVLLTVLVSVVLAGCGGSDDASASQESEALPSSEEVASSAESQPADETAEVEETTASASSGGSQASGSPPAPGSGRLELDDGRVFAITVTECEFQPNGTFTVNGTGDDGASFEMTQFYLGEEWSQSQVDLQFPNSDRVYVIVSRATEGAEPATVAGKSVSWTQTFRELDESANRHVYEGEGTVRATCA